MSHLLVRSRALGVQLLALLYVLLPRAVIGADHCQPLPTLSFGQILHNGSTALPMSNPGTVFTYECARGYNLVNSNGSVVSGNVTLCQSSGEWSLVGVQCEAISCGSPPLVTNGQVVIDTRDSLVGARVLYRCDPGYSLEVQDSDVVVVSQGFLTSVCLIGGQWSVVPTCVADSSGVVLTDLHIAVIILGIVAGVGLIFVCLFTIFCLWALKMRRDLTRGDMSRDEVAYTHTHGAITLNNPLVTPKDDESLGNPLYLTPDEIDEFEGKKKQTTNNN